MKKSIILTLIAAVILVSAIFYIAFNYYKEQVNYQKNILTRQAEMSIGDIENVIQRFESDLSFVLFSDDISELFSDRFQTSNPLRKLELFYSSYSNLIKNIDIYDNNKNVLNLFKDKKNNYITDRYLAQRQRKLAELEEVKVHDSEYQYLVPVFKDKEVYGNIIIAIDFSKYIISELNKYHLPDIYYQSLIDPQTRSIVSNFPGNNISMQGLEQIIKNLHEDHGDMIEQAVTSDSLKIQSTTVFLPLNVLDHKFGLAFSINNYYLLNRGLIKLLSISFISILLFIVTVLFLLIQIRHKEKTSVYAKNEITRLSEVLEHLPIGIIIFDTSAKIHYINRKPVTFYN
jgi:hypothetical protein